MSTNHMFKEIFEEPQVVKETIRRNITKIKNVVGEIESSAYRRFYITGSGTSYHAGLACQYVFLNLGETTVSLIPASEFTFWIPKSFEEKALTIAISQSGENKDILDAVETCLKKGIDVLAVTNTEGSTLATKSNYKLLTHAGKELAVTATKSYIAQLAVLFLFSLDLVDSQRGIREIAVLRHKLMETPDLIKDAINLSKDTTSLVAEQYKDRTSFFVLGSGANYVTALETALKLKESCNIFAEGFASREFLHGPIQLVNEKTPVIFVLHSNEVGELMSLITSIRRFGAPLISISDSGGSLKDIANSIMTVPSGLPRMFAPILYMPPLQLFAYYSSIARGLNPDEPEKLSKVVRL